ncbi:hypothetical protein [Gulosibacter hominis]|uniref:hypothetical protein n=1 Tax=Gulosibacter hominis TaxID=2770504 RepID=UPI001918EF45|nr:hypothetical protein [Gulosibacter hominis]
MTSVFTPAASDSPAALREADAFGGTILTAASVPVIERANSDQQFSTQHNPLFQQLQSQDDKELKMVDRNEEIKSAEESLKRHPHGFANAPYDKSILENNQDEERPAHEKLRPHEAEILKDKGIPFDPSEVDYSQNIVRREPGEKKPELEGTGIYVHQAENSTAAANAAEALRDNPQSGDGVLYVDCHGENGGWDDFNKQYNVTPSQAMQDKFDELSRSGARQTDRSVEGSVGAEFGIGDIADISVGASGESGVRDRANAGDTARAGEIQDAALGNIDFQYSLDSIRRAAVANAESGESTTLILNNGQALTTEQLKEINNLTADLREDQGADFNVLVTGTEQVNEQGEKQELAAYLRDHRLDVSDGATPAYLDPNQVASEAEDDKPDQPASNPDDKDDNPQEDDKPVDGEDSRPEGDERPEDSRPEGDERPEDSRPEGDERPEDSRPEGDERPEDSRPEGDERPEDSRPEGDERPEDSRPEGDERPEDSRPEGDERPEDSRPEGDERPEDSRPEQDKRPEDPQPEDSVQQPPHESNPEQAPHSELPHTERPTVEIGDENYTPAYEARVEGYMEQMQELSPEELKTLMAVDRGETVTEQQLAERTEINETQMDVSICPKLENEGYVVRDDQDNTQLADDAVSTAALRSGLDSDNPELKSHAEKMIDLHNQNRLELGGQTQAQPEPASQAVPASQMPDLPPVSQPLYRPDENPGQVSAEPYQGGASFQNAAAPAPQPGAPAPAGEMPNPNGFGFSTSTEFVNGTLTSQTSFNTPLGGAQASGYIGQQGIGFDAHGIPAGQPIGDIPAAAPAQPMDAGQPDDTAQPVESNQPDELAAPAEQPAEAPEVPPATTSFDLNAELEAEVNVTYEQTTYEQPQPELDQSAPDQSAPDQSAPSQTTDQQGAADQQGAGQGDGAQGEATADAQNQGQVGAADLAAEVDGQTQTIENQAPTQDQQIQQKTLSV